MLALLDAVYNIYQGYCNFQKQQPKVDPERCNGECPCVCLYAKKKQMSNEKRRPFFAPHFYFVLAICHTHNAWLHTLSLFLSSVICRVFLDLMQQSSARFKSLRRHSFSPIELGAWRAL